MKKVTLRKMAVMGLYFGLFQAGMPLIGYSVATLFANQIIAFDHWVAFVLLCFLGGKMIHGSFQKSGCEDRSCPEGTCPDRACPGGEKPNQQEAALTPAHMLPLALATSIDAMAVGVSYALLKVDIIPVVTIIGFTTFFFSMAGVKIGNVFGLRFKSKAELAGGVILALMGIKILLEHLGILAM
jgi:putative Mn2+ efflux pump MntP